MDTSPPWRCRRPSGREVMNPTASDVVEEISAWAIGGGVLTAALFPFALPILLLTVAFVLPSHWPALRSASWLRCSPRRSCWCAVSGRR